MLTYGHGGCSASRHDPAYFIAFKKLKDIKVGYDANMWDFFYFWIYHTTRPRENLLVGVGGGAGHIIQNQAYSIYHINIPCC